MVVKKGLKTIENRNKKHNAIERLLEYGEQQGSVTLHQVYRFLPQAEQDESLLEEVIEALADAGIPFEERGAEAEEKEDDLALEYPRQEETAWPVMEPDAASLNDIGSDDAVRLYFKEATSLPLLTAKEEKELSQRIERGRLAQQELARGKARARRLKELRELIEDGWAARERLIRSNSRLVISVAKKYIGRGVPFLDLVQEGNIGLMRAAKKFEYRRGYKFSTYATWWIRQAITRAIADQSRTVRLPVHIGDQINRLLRVQHQLVQDLGRTPTTEELAEALGVPIEKVEQMTQAAQLPLSLQNPIGEEEDESLGDFIEDRSAPDPEGTAFQTVMQEDLKGVLDKLPPRELRVLQLRYGLIDGQPLTLQEVGRRMGITRERVRQLETQAFQRLRSPETQVRLQAYAEE